MKGKLGFIVLLALALALIAGGCGGAAAPTPTTKPAAAPTPTTAAVSPATLAEGKTLFEAGCAACHGMDAKGLPGLGKDMTTSEFIKSQSDADLLAFVQKGRPAGDPANTTGVDMPPKGGNPALTEDQLKAIIAYIRSLK